MTFAKECPECGDPMVYTNASNLQRSIRLDISCRSCSQKLRPYENLFNLFNYKCRYRAIPCELTYRDFLRFTETKHCHYCNAPISWLMHSVFKTSNSFAYNLDRIDNSKGYSKNNCCVCCSICNSIKSDRFDHHEMVELGHTIQKIQEARICHS